MSTQAPFNPSFGPGSQPSKPAFTLTGSPSYRADITTIYERYGLTPTEADFTRHATNTGGLGAIENEVEARSLRPVSPTSVTPGPGAVVPNPTTPGATTPGAPTTTPAAGTRTGWGYNAPTGGSQTFAYTPGAYTGGYGNTNGWRSEEELRNSPDADRDSLKYVVKDLMRGLEDDGAFTEADVDELVRRAVSAGLPAKKVDAYQIDFGLGEGPIQVRHSGDYGWWNNRATEGNTSMADLAQPVGPIVPPVTPGTTTPTSQTLVPVAPDTGPYNPDGTPKQPDDPEDNEATRSYFESHGVQVLEVVGNQMRVLTEEDQRRGNVYGTWIEISHEGDDRSLAPSMASLAY